MSDVRIPNRLRRLDVGLLTIDSDNCAGLVYLALYLLSKVATKRAKERSTACASKKNTPFHVKAFSTTLFHTLLPALVLLSNFVSQSAFLAFKERSLYFFALLPCRLALISGGLSFFKNCEVKCFNLDF